MLYSTDLLKEHIRDYLIKNVPNKEVNIDDLFNSGMSQALAEVVRVIEDSEIKNSQIEKPSIVLADNEKGVILYCDEELWSYIMEIKNSNIDKIGIQDVAKIWLKLKKILKNQTSTTVKEI